MSISQSMEPLGVTDILKKPRSKRKCEYCGMECGGNSYFSHLNKHKREMGLPTGTSVTHLDRVWKEKHPNA